VTSERPEPGRLPRDLCGLPIMLVPEIEAASWVEQVARADRAWSVQLAGLAERSPFYARKWRAVGASAAAASSVTDLSRLPFTTKDETRETQETRPPWGHHLGVDPVAVKRVFQTSGSSGRPSLIALTAADIDTWTAIGARSYYTTGIHPHHSVLTTFGAGPFVAGQTHDTFDQIGVRRVPVGPGDTERVLNALRLGLVDTMLSTPSFALYLASRLESLGIDGRSLGLAHIAVGGEPGGGIPAIRGAIESAFGAVVTDAGGIGDIAPSLYGECPLQEGMHFGGMGLVWLELIDPATEAPVALETGARGELVYTSLVREAMPLVRFRSRDVAEIMGMSCACGRVGPRLRIVGRSDDMFIVRGVNVFPSAIQAVVGEFEPLVTGRLRVVLPQESGVTIEPPSPSRWNSPVRWRRPTWPSASRAPSAPASPSAPRCC
jgi:phenylacetate-CoA ligase